MKRLFTKAIRLTRIFLGIHPEVRANDAAWSLFSWTVLMGFLVVLTTILQLADPTARHAMALAAASWFYIGTNALYSIYSAIYYPNKVKFAESAAEQGINVPGLFRRGELIGAFFIVIEGMLTPIGAALLKHPTPPDALISAGATVGLLAASSGAKVFHEPTRIASRTTHDMILFRLCVAMTGTIIALLTSAIVWETPFSEEIFGVYATLLASYMGHKVVFRWKYPDEVQRRAGHLVAFVVTTFTVITIAAYAFGLIGILPLSNLWTFYGITATVLFIGAFAQEISYRWKHSNGNQKNGTNALAPSDDGANGIPQEDCQTCNPRSS
jgi:hypothetical protein